LVGRLRDLLNFLRERKNLVYLLLISFTINTGFSSVSILIPYYILSLKGVLRELPELASRVEASEAVVEMGVMTSAFMLVRAPLATAFGWLSDEIGRKRLILLGSMIYILTGFLYFFARNWTDLVYIRALQGAASAMVWPVAEALLSESVPREFRGRALALYVSSMNAGVMIGPSLGAFAYKATVLFGVKEVQEALRIPFLLIATFNLVALFSALPLKEKSLIRGNEASDEREEETEEKMGIRSLGRDQRVSLYVMFLNGLINGFAVGIISSVMSVYAIEYVVKDPLTLGAIMSLSALLGMSASYPAAWLGDKMGRKGIIVLGYVISRLSIFAIPLISTPEELFLLMSATHMSFNVSFPLMRALQADISPSEIRGRVFGIQQTFFNTGMILGPIIGALIYSRTEEMILPFDIRGVVIPFWISGSLGVFTLYLFAKFVVEIKDSE